jgi:hypothetical protein
MNSSQIAEPAVENSSRRQSGSFDVAETVI